MDSKSRFQEISGPPNLPTSWSGRGRVYSAMSRGMRFSYSTPCTRNSSSKSRVKVPYLSTLCKGNWLDAEAKKRANRVVPNNLAGS